MTLWRQLLYEVPPHEAVSTRDEYPHERRGIIGVHSNARDQRPPSWR